MIDLVSKLEQEGKIMADIRRYLLSIMEEKQAEKKAEEFNNLFEKIHND